MRILCEQREESGGLHSHHMHRHHGKGHHGKGHHGKGHHGHMIRHGHLPGHPFCLGAHHQQGDGHEMAIGHHHYGGRGLGHLKHRGRKVIFHGLHGHGGKHHKLHGHHHRHGNDGHNIMHKKKKKKGHCCVCYHGHEEETNGQVAVGQRNVISNNHDGQETQSQEHGGDAAATQLASLVETHLIVSETES